MTNNDAFFKNQKKHTKIKLNLFEEALSRSLVIANEIARRYPNKPNIFTYVDLYSGPGITGDGSVGSPIIALNKINEQATSQKNNFKEFHNFLFEMKPDHFTDLQKNVQNVNSDPKMKIRQIPGDWHTTYHGVHPNSCWGFIFADPYQDNLELKKLIEFSKCISKVDLMIFLNVTEIKRKMKNANVKKDLRLFKGYKEISHTRFLKDSTNEEFFGEFDNLVRYHLSNIKDKFVVHATIPVERKGKINNLDYAILSFISGQQGVIDAYLNEYNNQLELFNKEYNQYSIFEKRIFDDNVEENIREIINRNKKITFYNLIHIIWDRPIKWTETRPDMFKIPTIRNIRDELNKKIADGTLKVKASDKFLLKRGKGLNVKSYEQLGNLKKIYFY